MKFVMGSRPCINATNKAVLGGTLFLAGTSRLSDQSIEIDLGDVTRTMHPLPSVGRIPIFPAFEDYLFMVSDICSAVGIDCDFIAMNGEIHNAITYRGEFGERIIVYERRFSPTIGYDGAQVVIAHEMGHHHCGHLSTRSGIGSHQAELEADAFMGFAMKMMSIPFESIQRTYELLGMGPESESHPSLTRRLAASRFGYQAGSLEDACNISINEGSKIA